MYVDPAEARRSIVAIVLGAPGIAWAILAVVALTGRHVTASLFLAYRL